MHSILQLINRLKSHNKSYYSKEKTSLKIKTTLLYLKYLIIKIEPLSMMR